MKEIRFNLILFAVGVITILITGCMGKKQEQPRTNVVPVKTADVKVEELSIPIHTSGRLYPKAMIKLSFKVGCPDLVGTIRRFTGPSRMPGFSTFSLFIY